MLLIFLSAVVLIPVLSGWGKLLETLSKTRLCDGASGKMLSGIFGISLVWTVSAFFLPLTLFIEIPTLLIGLFYFFKGKGYSEVYSISAKQYGLLGTGSLVILFCSSFYPYILDHFGYYFPTIQWLREYGLVKGISNLDLVLGQMSIWHIFQAGFSNFSDPFLRINAILLLVYLFYIIEKKSWIQLCFIPILLVFSQSPSPDLPVIIFSLIILNEIVSANKNTAMLFAFSVFVFAIKPTMIWLPVLTFLYAVFIVQSHFKVLLAGCAVFFIFCLKNIWTFGYPIFPISMIDFGVNWKPNQELLKSSAEYAIQKTFDNQYSYQEIQKFSTFEYVKNWLFLDGIKSVINCLFIVSLLVFTVFTFFKKNKITTFIWISVMIKSILVLSFSAQYRFFMDVFFLIIFVMFFDFLNKKRSTLIYAVLLLLFTGFITFPPFVAKIIPSYRMSSYMGGFTWKQLYTPSIYEYKKYNTFTIGNLRFNVSEKYPFTFDTPAPAISDSFVFDYQKSGIFPQLIDKNDIKKGFIFKKITDKERMQLKKATDKITDSYQ